MTSFDSPEDIINFFNDYDLGQSSRDYLKFHALRYFILWAEVARIVKCYCETTPTTLSSPLNKGTEPVISGGCKAFKILDVGPGFFTEILDQKLMTTYPNLQISSLGLKSDYIPFKSEINFINLDLNDLYLKPENIPDLGSFDLIICAEVLEHLYTGIDASLQTFSKWLKPRGTLIIQTPNAVSLHHRLKLLFGKNPFPLLRPNPLEPGHYREYTLQELKISLKKAGLKPAKIETHNYFNYKGNRKNSLYKMFCNLLPSGFRDGVVMICKPK